MIKELIPLLSTHKLAFEVELKDNDLWVYILPTVSDESITDKDDKAVLEKPTFKKYNPDTFTNEQLVEDIHAYANVLIEGTTSILDIEKEIKERAEAKKAKAAPKAPAKPKRKTKKQLMDEEREKQAKEREGKEPPKEDGDRLEAKSEEAEITDKIQKASKALETTKAEVEAEDIASAVDNKDDDPLGLGLGDLDI